MKKIINIYFNIKNYLKITQPQTQNLKSFTFRSVGVIPAFTFRPNLSLRVFFLTLHTTKI
jgi:hypothetical protein